MLRVLLLALMVTFLSSPAAAAGVELVQGQVSINRGEGYQPVADFVAAVPGDLVMASPNGLGRITYTDGCVVEVQPGAVVAIEEKSPCSAGQARFKPGYLIAGALVVGAVAGAIALTRGDGDGKKAFTDDDDSPASP